MKRSRRIYGLAALTLIPALTPAAVHACDTVDGIMCGLPPPDVAAGERDQMGGLNTKIARALQQAWKLAAAQDFTTARAKLAPVTALAKTKAETAAVDSARAFIAFSLKDLDGAAAAFADSLDAGAVDAKDVPNRLAALTQLYFQTKNYAQAIAYGDRYTREVGPDSDILMITAQAHYIGKDYPAAARDVHAALETAAKAGTVPKEEWLQVAMSAGYYTKDTPAVVASLEKLVELYPQPKYWNDLLQFTVRDTDPLEVYRLRLATGALTTANQYADMVTLALGAGLPGEARSVLDRARAAGLQGPENFARVAAEAEDDFKTLAKCEADARAQKGGDAEVATGTAYGSYGQHAKAITMIQDGLTRGVKDKDQALLRLGLAYADSGQKDEALKALAAVGKDSASAQVARLWTIALTHPPGGVQLAASK